MLIYINTLWCKQHHSSITKSHMEFTMIVSWSTGNEMSTSYYAYLMKI